MSEVYEMKPLSQVDVQPTPADNAYVLIEQDGEIMRAPKDTIGITDIEPVEPGIGITWLTQIGVSNDYAQFVYGKDGNGDRIFADGIRDAYDNGIVRICTLEGIVSSLDMIGYHYYNDTFMINIGIGMSGEGTVFASPVANNAGEEIEQVLV